MWLEVVVLVLVYAMNIRTFESGSCPASKDTVHRVPSCPRNKEEWKQRSDAKNCSTILQNCTESSKFVYHCVINSYVNETLEVCAPEKQLIGHSCVEYNERGGLIQESSYVKCNDPRYACQCPFSYISTDVYQYQHCFQAIGSSKSNLARHSHGYLTMDSNRSRCVESCDYSRERNWQIAAVVMIIINVVLFGTTLWMVVSRRKTMRCCKANRPSEEIPPEETPLMKEEKANNRGNKMSDKDFYVAAIDISDRYFTMALTHSKSPEDVKPLGKRDRICLLLDDKGDKVRSFGIDAMKDYLKEKGGNYIHDFKLNKGHKDSGQIEKVYDLVVSMLLQRIQSALGIHKSYDRKKDFHMVFIVPTYWGKEDITKLDGRVSKKLKELDVDCKDTSVIRREEAVPPFIHEVNARVLCLNFNVDNLVFKSDEKTTHYANLHIGSSYHYLLLRPVGGSGKIGISETCHWQKSPYECMLEELGTIFGISEQELKDWEKDHQLDYILFLTKFEELQKFMNEQKDDSDKKFELEVPKTLYDMAKRASRDLIKERVNTMYGEGIEMKGEVEDRKFFIRPKYYKRFFNMMNKTISKIMEGAAKRQFKEHNVKCVVMTGAYSLEEEVRKAAEEGWLKGKQITVVIPENTQAFALGGAYYKCRKLQEDKSDE